MTASRMMMFLQDMGMGLFRGGAASDEELADPFGDQRRLVLALDLDRKFERLLPLAGALFVEFNERSEEHTSELQSLMRISYAVFCLKTKNIHILQFLY